MVSGGRGHGADRKRFLPEHREGDSLEIEHSLDSAALEILTVAKWWELDPEAVGRWTMPDFTDRQEFMFIQFELSRDPADKPPAGKPWAGPKA